MSKQQSISRIRVCLGALISFMTTTAIAASAFVTLTTETVAQAVPTDFRWASCVGMRRPRVGELPISPGLRRMALRLTCHQADAFQLR